MLIEMYESAIASNPSEHSKLVSLMHLDMTMKNGGVACWLDYGPKGIGHIADFGKRYNLPVLEVLCDVAVQYGKVGMVAGHDELTNSYYAVMDEITELLYLENVRA